MAKRDTQELSKLLVRLALLLGVFFILGALEVSRERFTSHEVTFTDESKNGLAIMPASCASDPWQYHTTMYPTADTLGYVAENGIAEQGHYKQFGPTLVVVCVTNTTGASYFVPANTAAELQTFITVGSSIPNLQVWGASAVGE